MGAMESNQTAARARISVPAEPTSPDTFVEVQGYFSEAGPTVFQRAGYSGVYRLGADGLWRLGGSGSRLDALTWEQLCRPSSRSVEHTVTVIAVPAQAA